MNKVLLLSVALLAGCTAMTQPEDIAVAEEMCAKRGGFTHLERQSFNGPLYIYCKDNTAITVRQ